ncbi:GNAT family N-acetyltransferase [Gaetbulibacter aestuarii]|uniref:GNAT family protein n=1 Tax=Gaetbulibacter aestuarii TaxID=1502358 RepID=A0ABW7N2H1_9FLAO
MKTLKGKSVYLRALEPEDLEFVHDIENDEDIWMLSNTQTPFSKYIIKKYLENALKDIYEVKQLRLVIETLQGTPIGLIDLFDFDFKNKRAGLGIIIKNEDDRNKGYGKEALKLLVEYSFVHLNLHQLYCQISDGNTSSIKLFKSQGFEEVGFLKDWQFNNNSFHSEYIFQLINN